MIMNRKETNLRTQKKILRFIDDFSRKNNFSPSMREITEAIGMGSAASVCAHMKRMKNEGYLEYSEGKSRSEYLTRAGRKLIGVESPIETNTVRIADDSLSGIGIFSDDEVTVRKDLAAKDGNIVVAILSGTRSVCRMLSGGKLESANGGYPTIDARDCQIVGVVVEVHRKYAVS